MKTSNKQTFELIKFNFGKAFANNGKAYATKQDAENAGNSWKNDCTIHSIIREGFYFEIHEINI